MKYLVHRLLDDVPGSRLLAAMRGFAIAVLLFLPVPAAWAAGAPVDTVKVVTTGEFYPYGNTNFHPPFVCTMVDTIGFINGVQVVPQLVRPQPPAKHRALTPTEQAQVTIMERAQRTVDSLRAAGARPSEISKAASRVYRADTAVVDSVTEDEATQLTVWWKDPPSPMIVLLAGPPRSKPNPRDQHRQMLASYAALLSMGGILVLGEDGFSLSAQPSDRAAVEADIERASHMAPDAITRASWKGILPVNLAREFANPRALSTHEK